MIYQSNLCQTHSLGDRVCLVQDHFIFVAVEDILPQHSGEVIVHIGVYVVELADEGVFYPVSDGLCVGRVGVGGRWVGGRWGGRWEFMYI